MYSLSYFKYVLWNIFEQSGLLNNGAFWEKNTIDFLAFEFFPELLQKAGKMDPLDLLLYVASFGYDCATHPSSLLPKVLPEHMYDSDEQPNEQQY